MSLYLLLYEEESFYVEADTLMQALNAWRAYLQKDYGTGKEEPVSITCVQNEPVIR